MSLNPTKTQNAMNPQYNMRSLFIADGSALKPLYVDYYVDPDLLEDIYFGEPLMWKDPIIENGIIVGGYVTPLTATYDAGTGEWTLGGQLATFSMNYLQAENNVGAVRGVSAGTVAVSELDLSKVSRTAGEDFTLAQLLKLATNMNGSLLPAQQYSGTLAYNLLGISPLEIA